jgi:hypothetical protein
MFLLRSFFGGFNGDVILMGAENVTGIRFHRLAPPGDTSGVSCDESGPAIGPIQLLTKSGLGFAPRPVDELNELFAYVIGCPVDCSDLVERLTGVAAALNEGERARAVFATLFMNLPSLSEDQARRAAEAAKLVKASPDDPEHPGWPKGTDGGKGGQFRTKDGAAEETTTAEKLARLVVRRQLRRALVHTLLRHAARLAVEAAGDAIPGLDVIAGASTIADFAAMAQENAALKRDGTPLSNLLKMAPIASNNCALVSTKSRFRHSMTSKRLILPNISVLLATATNITISSSRARAGIFRKANCNRQQISFEFRDFCMRRSVVNILPGSLNLIALFAPASMARALTRGGTLD